MTASPEMESQLRQFATRGDHAGTLKAALAIVQVDDSHAEAHFHLGRIRMLQGIWADAERHAGRALQLQPQSESALLLMSSIQGTRGQTAEALKFCDHALELYPTSLPARQNRAQLLERAGDWQAALEMLSSEAGSVPGAGAALLTARCHHASGDADTAIATIDVARATSGAAIDPRTSAQLLLARARALDTLGRYDEAFADAASAKQLRGGRFDPDAYVAEVDAIISAFPAERVKRIDGATDSAHQHLFIAGMPRSGTTLVEQILDAHPDATGVGEAKEIEIFAQRLQKFLGVWSSWPACVEHLSPEKRPNLVTSYEDALRDYGFTTSGFFVNKSLHNLRLLGLIAMLFPNAKVVFTHRDPRDMGLSCFMSNLTPEVHPYLFNLDHIALAIEQHQRLLDHWKSVLDLQWLDVRYEDMVANQEATTRSLLEFCELPWNDRCLSFFESDRTVMTLSYDQVNKPIYTSSVGRYRNYESHLQPLMSLVD